MRATHRSPNWIAGELDAIPLAGELRADPLLVDDREGRREAEKRAASL
jgi:predicted nucleic acid-binding protein